MSSFLIWCLKRFFVISVQLQRFTKSLLPMMAPTTVIMRSFIIHKALAGLDVFRLSGFGRNGRISIHKALAGLDNTKPTQITQHPITFQSTRPSRASTYAENDTGINLHISIHKALAGLDNDFVHGYWDNDISIHKALAGLDFKEIPEGLDLGYFNPQGPRGPRQSPPHIIKCFLLKIQGFSPFHISVNKPKL